MSFKQKVGRLLDNIGLKKFINEIRFSLIRPDWWLERKKQYRFYAQFFKSGDLCFDVGANYGNFAQMISELGGRVVAIEPQPACHLILKDKLTCFQSAQIVEMAVGSEEGSTEMMLAGEGSQISSLSKEWVETVKRTNRFSGHSWESKINVPVTTLDALIEEYGIPTFCKIDVEGYEKEVLQGLSHAPRFLSFEYTPEHQGAMISCINRLMEIGSFKFNLALHDNWQFYWSKWLTANKIIEQLEASDKNSPILKGGDIYASRQDLVN